MLRGLYYAASSMVTQITRQDIHAGNLANVDTTGFKRCLADVSANPGQTVDASQGAIRQTGSPLDVALSGPGYFVIQTPTGRAYTRNGHFSLDAAGRLVNGQGQAVLGEGGEIRLGPGTVEIQANGTIMQGGRRVDRLLIVDFAPNAALTRLGNGAINGAAAPTPVASPSLTQGSLETSNVNAVIELGAMQRGFRAYEANTNAIRAADQTLGRLIDSTTA
ncbi:MAG: flagellar hook-basal body protein [Acidobacteriota bacterium]|nr:flagellar hook-basal body protein [Acidobacteriota bacterium]